MKSRIYLIRHGITEGNQKRWYYGATDVPLSAEGVSALKTLAEKGVYPPAEGLLFTSGLLRTEQTLEAIWGEQPHGVIAELQEYNFGVFECKSHAELLAQPDYQDWLHHFSDRDYIVGGGESRNQFEARIRKGWQHLLSAHLQSCARTATIMVCHGGVISKIMDLLFPEGKKNMYEWCPEPGLGYLLLLEESHVVGYDFLQG